jgi:SAM-dependent methyltransferase
MSRSSENLNRILRLKATFAPFEAILRPVQVDTVEKFLRRDRDGVGQVRILDIGSGTDSVRHFRDALPECEYWGVDRDFGGSLSGDLRERTHLIVADLEQDGALCSVPPAYFDVIVFSHVLEHISDYQRLLREASSKVRTGGTLYLEFPSVASLHFPTRAGTLNFRDDPTHKSPPDVSEVRDLLIQLGFRVVLARKRRSAKWILLSPARVVFEALRGNPVPGPALWDLLGFAEQLVAVKS